MQEIRVSAGEVAYTYPAQASSPDGTDISALAVKVRLVPSSQRIPPDANDANWRTPEVSVPTAPSRTVQLLIGGSYLPAVGHYRMFGKIVATPAIPVFEFVGVHVRVM